MERPVHTTALPLRVHRLDPAAPGGAQAWTAITGEGSTLATAVSARVRDSLNLRVVRCGKVAAGRLVPDAAHQR